LSSFSAGFLTTFLGVDEHTDGYLILGIRRQKTEVYPPNFGEFSRAVAGQKHEEQGLPAVGGDDG